jgi:hypothetical protein
MLLENVRTTLSRLEEQADRSPVELTLLPDAVAAA